MIIVEGVASSKKSSATAAAAASEKRKKKGSRALALARDSLGRTCRRLLNIWAAAKKGCPDKSCGKEAARPTSSCSPDLIADCIEFLNKSSARAALPPSS